MSTYGSPSLVLSCLWLHPSFLISWGGEAEIVREEGEPGDAGVDGDEDSVRRLMLGRVVLLVRNDDGGEDGMEPF